ncbi:MAG: YIP1 family protein [Wenzhouxiangella sp.]
MVKAYGIGQALVDIIAAPSKALDEIRDRVSWLWVPLFIVILLAVASQVVYTLWVDLDWLIDQTVAAAMAGGADPAAEQAIRQWMQPTTLLITAIVGILFVLLIVHLLQAVYLHLLNKLVGNPDLRFGQWFALSVWSAFPMIFQSLAAFGLMALTADRRLTQEELGPLSLQSLLIRAEPGSSWAAWGSAIDLITLWVIGLLALGIMRWTGASVLKAITIAAAPYALIFGIWALVIS